MADVIPNIPPFSRLGSLPGFQYHQAAIASKDFIHFESRQKAYKELLETLKNDSIHMIGLYGEGGSGKTTLVTEVGKKAVDGKMFDKVISITVSQPPNIRDIQETIADLMKFKFEFQSNVGRAQDLWNCLKQKKRRILFIVNNLWGDLKLNDIGILLDDDIKKTCKILITTPHERVCISMDCQKTIQLELLSKEESWKLFKKFARINEKHSTVLNDVPRELCNECMGLPIAIKIVGSLFKKRKEIEWQQAHEELMASKASDDEERVTTGRRLTNLSYDHLPAQRAKQIFLLCALYPGEYHIRREDLLRYAHGLDDTIISLLSTRSSFNLALNTLLKSCLVSHGSVKMHNMVRDAALWIANRSKNSKILVNVDKPLSTVTEDNNIRNCFALSSWWYNENPSFCQLYAPDLKMLLVNISAHSSLNSLDLSPLTFEGIQGLQVFSLTINYKIVPISFPPSIQLLTNVRTLRLNGLKLGDISFITSLTTLEILDLRRCYFDELPIVRRLMLIDLSECHISENNYNGALHECSQLEELYALPCYTEANVPTIIIDTKILPKLKRFELSHSFFPKEKIFIELKNSNISKFKVSKNNILQMAETISLTGLHGECKNIIPDIVGGVNNLSTLHLENCKEIKCISDATCDLKEDDLIPRLVELRLESMHNLTELFHGSPLQVLHVIFEKLELLHINSCQKLHVIFPRECKLQNLKFLRLSYCKTDEVLFSESVAQSLHQLEQLTIDGCSELKHIISASGSEHGDCSASENIKPAPRNSHVLMTNLRDIKISSCKSLEWIFPISYVKGLARLQKMDISFSPKLEYVFGEYDDEKLSSIQYQNHVMLPHLELLELNNLENLIWLCPENCQPKWPSQPPGILTISKCPKLIIPSLNLRVDHDQTQHRLNENSLLKLENLGLELHEFHSISLPGPAPRQIWNFQILQSIKVGNCENMKYLLSMETCTSLPELTSLKIDNCQELEQIVAANEELVQLANAELYFPKLKYIEVQKCNKLKSLFPFAMVKMLPQLSELYLSKASQLEEVFRRSGGDDSLNTMEIVLPNLTTLTLADLRNFVDICRGSKLRATLLVELNISHCRNIAPTSSLRNIVVARMN